MLKIIYRLIRNFFNKIFKFKYMDLQEESKYLIYSNIDNYYHIDYDKLDSRWRNRYTFVNTWQQETYVMHYPQSCYIEPIYGYAITKNNQYLLHSKAGSYKYLLFGSSYGKTPPPDRFVFFLKKRKAIKLDKAISLNTQENFGKNYYAAYNGALGQLYMMEKYGVDLTLPVIVPKSLFETKFFQQIISLSPKLKNINWITRNDIDYDFKNAQYFQCRELYTARAVPYSKTVLIPLTEWFDNIQPQDNAPNDRKVFLTRSLNRPRHLRNKEEIEHIVSSLGFEIIDTDNLTVKEQIQLFRNVSMLIAMHGAGNINIMFRYPKKLKFLDIQIPELVSSGYLIVAAGMEFDYDIYWGTGLDGDIDRVSSFYIDPNDFKEKIINWIKK